MKPDNGPKVRVSLPPSATVATLTGCPNEDSGPTPLARGEISGAEATVSTQYSAGRREMKRGTRGAMVCIPIGIPIAPMKNEGP